MDYIIIYILLFLIIAIVGEIFNKSIIPSALVLVFTGMMLSLFPKFPIIEINPKLVLDVFLPLIIYHISTVYSWRDLKNNLVPITFLSVGHVVFITFIVSILVKHLIPELSWPVAIVLGSVISPLDDVALVAIAEKIRLPRKVITILKGEGMLNDSIALIIFRFALITVITHKFILLNAIFGFFSIIVCEILYGLILGFIIGRLRLLIKIPEVEILASILTPFIAYFPPEMLGGCGILSTIMTGLIIEKNFSHKFDPEIRFYSQSVWSTLNYAIEGFLFIMVGIEMKFILNRISYIPLINLFLYSTSIIFTVILGRFIWVFTSIYLPNLLFSSNENKKLNIPTWQHTFLISWSGMRGGISLAGALAVPTLPIINGNLDPSDLIVFLVFTIILTTLILQWLTLPIILQKLGLKNQGEQEIHLEIFSELSAREAMAKAVLKWLHNYKKRVSSDENLLKVINIRIQEYLNLRNHLQRAIKGHDTHIFHEEESELKELLFVSSHITEIERDTLLSLWKKEEINLCTKNKILNQLDRRAKKIVERS